MSDGVRCDYCRKVPCVCSDKPCETCNGIGLLPVANGGDQNGEGFAVPRQGDIQVAKWQPIETAPTDGTLLLLYCPFGSGKGSYHSWATHWMPLPESPK